MIRTRNENIKTFADFVEQIKRDGLYDSYYCGTALFMRVVKNDGKERVESNYYNTAMDNTIIEMLAKIEN